MKIHTSPEEFAHYNRTEQYARRVGKLFDKLDKEIIRIVGMFNLDGTKPFNFADYPAINKLVEKAMRLVADGTEVAVMTGIENEWLEANFKNDNLVKKVFGTRLSKEQLKQFKPRNLEALQGFKDSTFKEIPLSDKVWEFTKQRKNEFTLAVDAALGQGKGAKVLGKELRKYLQNPDAAFRRVRDKHGKLVPSDAEKAYHPGQGVYKSAKKNAERYTRTTINASYRMSDHTRVQGLPFVVGIRISVSQRGKHCPLCEQLQGDYPKGFVFTGWHPHCFCYQVSIMMTGEEMDRMEDEILAGAEITTKSVNEVVKLPSGAVSYMEYLKKGGKKHPRFIGENAGYFGVSNK